MTQLYNSFWQRNLLVCFIGSFSTVFAMTLMLPFLPLYVEELGVSGHAAVVQWSGVAFSATFITAGLIAPVWGKLGDRYGRKSMLVRASLGMAVTVSLMGLVTNIWQLVGLRLVLESKRQARLGGLQCQPLVPEGFSKTPAYFGTG